MPSHRSAQCCSTPLPGECVRGTGTAAPWGEECAGTSWRPGAASRLWQHHALEALDADLQSRFGAGAGIVYRLVLHSHVLKIAQNMSMSVVTTQLVSIESHAAVHIPRVNRLRHSQLTPTVPGRAW